MKLATLGRRQPRQWPQEGGIRKEQRCRKISVANQFARPVDVLQQQVEQLRTLNDAGLEEAPFFGRDQEWDGIDSQRPVYTLRVGIDVISDTVFPNPAFRALPAANQLVRSEEHT